jgi:hypothetical protein
MLVPTALRFDKVDDLHRAFQVVPNPYNGNGSVPAVSYLMAIIHDRVDGVLSFPTIGIHEINQGTPPLFAERRSDLYKPV